MGRKILQVLKQADTVKIASKNYFQEDTLDFQAYLTIKVAL